MRDGARIAAELGGRRNSRGWTFRCPCHQTHHDGAILFDSGVLYCPAGCPSREIGAALDDLDFPDDGTSGARDEEKEAQDDAAAIARARQMWDDAVPGWWFDDPVAKAAHIEQVASYLRSRGITLPVPPVLRAKYRSKFIAAVQQLDGSVVAVTEKYPRGFPHKSRTTGRVLSGAVQLAAPLNGELGLTEGVEDALSVIQMFGVPTWAAIGTRLEKVALPPGIRKVYLFPDNNGKPGRDAAERARREIRSQNITVEIWWPPEGLDFNDYLRRGE